MGLICVTGQEARALRRELKLNQEHFWGQLGVTQSGGSRYEAGREMPYQVAVLLHLAFGAEELAGNCWST